MAATAAFLLSLIYAILWWRQPGAKAYLLFTVAASATAIQAGFELEMARADSPAAFSTAMRWDHTAIWVLVLSLAGFVRLQLRAGRIWLLYAICISRTLALALNFLTGENLNYRAMVGLRRIPFLGESVSFGVGLPNPWMLVGQSSLLALAIFAADASVTAWRRGERRSAVIVGGSITVFLLAGLGQAAAVFWGFVQWPIMVSWFFLGIVLAMSYELAVDASQASKLAGELRSKDRQIALTSEAAESAAQQHRSEIAQLARTESLGALSSALVHELAQPLTSILMNAQAAEMSLARGQCNPEELRDIVRDIIADDKRAAELIDNLRRFLGKGSSLEQFLATNDLVQDVLKLTRRDLTSRSIRVVTHLANDLPTLRGNRVQLQQVLVNLILNARDAMNDVAPEARALTVASHSFENQLVEIVITDTGCGFPHGAEERIFESYYTTKALGLGLGLSLSRSIITAHGGRLWAEQSPVRGASFHCLLPVPVTESESFTRRGQ